MSPYTLVKLSRLAVPIRVISTCNGDLLRLLFVTRGSQKSSLASVEDDLVEDDFDWIKHMATQDSVFQQFCSPTQWCQAFKADPKHMRKEMENVCATRRANILTTLPCTPAIAFLGATCKCDVCGEMTKSKQALRSHAFNMHKGSRNYGAPNGDEAALDKCGPNQFTI